MKMFYKHPIIFILNLIIWIHLFITNINAYYVDITNPCSHVIKEQGTIFLNRTSFEKINSEFNISKCNNKSFQLIFKEGTYQLEKTQGFMQNIFFSYFEPLIAYYGISFHLLNVNIDIIGEVDENNEPITTLKCPGYGYYGFIDTIHNQKKVTFKNIRFTECYNHWFKLHHFRSFDSDSPEYIFENCIFEKNYDESIFFYEYLAGEVYLFLKPIYTILKH